MSKGVDSSITAARGGAETRVNGWLAPASNTAHKRERDVKFDGDEGRVIHAEALIKPGVGYVFARKDNSIVRINIQLLRKGIDIAEAIATLVSKVEFSDVQVAMSRTLDTSSLQRVAGRSSIQTKDHLWPSRSLPE